MNYPNRIAVPVIHEKETDSTNNRLAQLCAKGYVKEFTTLLADHQTAGKGQRGNSWESAPGMNLTFSTVFYPTALKAREQFILSMAIAVAIYDALNGYTDGFSIKWPNDIYWKDRKLCGILIENELEGSYVVRSIAGIGINVNQDKFLSPAPNPVSLKQIMGLELDRMSILENVTGKLVQYYTGLESDVTYIKDAIRTAYLHHQYRQTGLHPYSDRNGTFKASLENIEPDGHLVLKDENGTMRKYAFKEVQYIL